MTTVLGIDWSADMAAEFGGQIATATFTRRTAGAYNPADPAGPPAQTVATFSCDAIAFSYDERFVEGDLIKKGDYQVTILIGTIRDEDDEPSGTIPNPGDEITVPPPASTTPATARVISVGSLTQAAVTVQVRGAGA